MKLITFIPSVFLLVPIFSFLAKRYIPVLAAVTFAASFILSVVCWMRIDQNPETISFTWFRTSDTNFYISFTADSSSLPTVSFVTFIGFLVASYSVSYFKNSIQKTGLFTTLALFMASMTGLILSSNLLFSFVCWELVGFCSYLLIGFYRDEEKAGKAATKALLINKVGDIGFLIALLGVWASQGSFDLTELAQSSLPNEGTFQYLIGFGLMTAIFAKSAQFPFHTWLPDAMAGPTPVSALIHSATMVASGIWLLSRVHFLMPVEVMWFAGFCGMITAVLGAWNALFQNKIKYLLAWSTVSQLGLMMMAAGWASTDSAVMHLITHGFFKAGLFLAAGYLLLQLIDNPEDELTSIGSIQQGDRLVAVALVIFTFSLAGLPLTAAFLSKEAIAAELSGLERISFFLISGLTIFYSVRLIWKIRPFLFGSRATIVNQFTWPILTLALACGWWIWSLDPIGYTRYFANGAQEVHLNLIIVASLFTLSVAYISYLGFKYNWITFLGKKEWIVNIDPLLHLAIVAPMVKCSIITGKIDRLIVDRLLHGLAYGKVALAHVLATFDRYVVDGLAELMATTFGWLGQLIRKATSGTIQSYLWWSLIALLILVIWQ